MADGGKDEFKLYSIGEERFVGDRDAMVYYLSDLPIYV